NKSKGVLITGLKLKAFRNPQPSWGFSIDNKKPALRAGLRRNKD
ncbi:ABC transporter ATP-binding protein, partial [Salmonella enterica subsp. enterica serovar Panama]